MIIKLFEKADPKETEAFKEIEALKKRVEQLEAIQSIHSMKLAFVKKDGDKK